MGAVLLGQLLVATGALAALSISPSPSTGSYTVSWTAPPAPVSTKLHERVGSGAWSVVGTYASTVSSKAFSGKAAGTYSYKTKQCFTLFGSPVCADSEGPESVTVSAAPTPAPTASISWNPSTVDYGGSSTLSWSSTNATGCTLDGVTRATAGSQVETNRTATQTSRLYCTGPGGTSDTDSATLTVGSAPQITIVPSPSPNGNYTVSWSAPATPYDQTRLLEKVGSGAWRVVGTYLSTVTSKAFRDKPGGTYQYKTQQCLDVLNFTHCSDLAGPASVEVTRPPTASISWNPSTVEYGGTSTLSWSSTSVTGCTLDGTDEGTSGSMVLANRTESQTNVLTCTTAGNGTVTDSATLRVRSQVLEITIDPSPSLDGNYTVSWGAPRCFGGGGFIPQICQVLQERVGQSGNWTDVPNVPPMVTSHAFSDKPNGTYYYRLMLGARVVARPASVEVTRPPTASISWNPSTVEYGGTSTLSWSSASVTGCMLDGTDRGTSGSMVLANRTESQTSVLMCTTAGNGTVTDSATLTVGSAPQITIEPSPSLDGDYTVSWSAPVAPYDQTRLLEKVGSGAWGVVGTYLSTVTSKVFRNKPGGTYQYKTQQCLDVLNITHCSDLAGPKSVTVTGPTPATPAPPTGPPTSTGSHTVRWVAVTSATGYKLQERRNTESWTKYDEGTATSKALSGKKSGAWEYQVQACNGAVCSGWSGGLTIEVRPLLEITIAPSPSTDGNYTVSWGAPRCFGVAGLLPQICYVLQERVGQSGNWTDVPGVATTATSHAFSAKLTGTYYYQLVIGVRGTVVVAEPESVEVERVPMATVSWNPSTVEYGGTSTLSWSSTSVTGCTLDGTDEETSGSMVLANRTESQTSVLMCTTAGNGTVTDSATLTVEPLPGITIEPSLSTDGNYTVSWNTPLCISRSGVQGLICRVLEERAGDDVTASWETVMDVSGTSHAFSDKPNGTYYYRLMLRTRPVAGPASVEVDRVPTASISWNPSTVEYGGTSTLSWSSTSVTGCTLDGTDEETSGSMVLANRTESQTNVLTCTTAGNGTVTDSATLTVGSAPQITIEPSPSLDGDYTVSWSAPVAPYDQTRLLEKVGSGAWGVVGTYLSTVTSKVFRNKPGGTYQYKTQQCLDVLNITRCSDLAGPKSVTVTGPTPATPATPTGPATSTGSHTVRWVAVTSATGYKLQERRNTESWTKYDEGTATSKALSGKKSGTWEYQVQACNGAVCSGWSGSLRILVSVAPPGTLTIEPSPSLDGDYTVSWSVPVAPYDQTRLLEKVGSGAWGVVGTYLSTVTSKVFRNKPGGTYQYKTQQCLDVLNITRCSDLAGPKSVTVTGPTPATPATPTGPATSTGSHTVRWVAVTSATGYKLQERRNTESWTKYDEGTATSKALSGKKSGTWEYQVQACNGAVCSGWSGSLRILVSVAPSGTLTIEPSPSLDGDYTVSWSAPVAPYDQTRLLEKVGSGAWGVVGTYLSTVTSKVFRNKPGGTYQYKTQQCLDVLNITRCSDLAGPASVEVTRPPVPAVPTASPEEPDAGGNYTVSWVAVAHSTYYELQERLGTDEWMTYTYEKDSGQYGVGENMNKEFLDQASGGWKYRVRACNAKEPEVCSDWSGILAVTVPEAGAPDAPAVPMLTGPAGSTGTHTISWNPVTGAERYELQARLDSGTWTMHNTGEETRKAFTALGYGDWEYQVRACNGEQCSGWSAGLTVVVGPGTVPKPPKPIVTAPGDVVSGTEQKAMDKVGTLAGEFRVAESGAATYRIALPLPAGTAGATPSLGLQYNSQRGNGLLGIGWTLDGLSAISRCRQTFAQDGKAQPLTFMDKDRFCLDGQRLLLTDDSPTQTYGAPNSKYKTEIDGFLTVTAKDGSAGQPDYFEVVRKDGSVSRYGATGVSAAEQRVYNPGGTAVDKVLTWALQEVRDSVGNRIVYSYTADEQGHRISKISYAYGSGNTARAEVFFTYEDRQDDTVGYLAGYKLQSTQRLQQVTVKSAGSSGGLVPLRKYKLRYRRIAPNATDVLSRLAGISECVGTSSACLPETRFTWSLPEALFKTTAASTLALNSDGWGPVDFSPADINGDGLTDLVWTETNNDKHRIQYALADRGTGRLQMKKFTNNQSRLEYNDDYGRANYGDNLRVHTEVVDYNADGRLDILVYSEGTDRTELHLAVPQSSGGWRLDGRGEFLFSGRYRYADLNSDGLLDAYKLVAVYGENTQVPTGYNLEVRYLKPASGQTVASDRYYAFGAAQTLTVAFAQLPPTSSSQDIDPNVLPSYFNWKTLRQSDLPLADVDGDGRADLITWGYDGTQTFDIGDQGFHPSYTLRRLEVFRQTDTGFVRYGSDGGIVLSSGQQSSIAKGVRAADLNRDGLSDLVYFVGRWYRKSSDNYQWTGDWQYRLSTGAGFTAAVTLLDVADNAQAPSSPSLHDDNGDGYPDFLWHDVPTRQVRVKRWSPVRGAFETGAPTRVRSASGKDDESYLTLDVNGDGNGDLLQVSTSGSRETVKTYLQSTTGRANLVRGVRNGLGAETDITYESLSTTDSYVRIAGLYSTPEEERCFDWQPGPGVYWLGLAGGGKYCYTVEAALEDADAFYEALNDPWQDLTDPVTGTSGAPVLELMGPLYVVTRVDSSAPTADAANAKSGIGYVYEQGKVQAAGRGLLGFKSLTTVDLQTGVRTTTTYRQDFPYIGLPLETAVKTAGMDGKLLRSAVNTWRLQGYRASWDARGSGGSTGSARLGPLQPYIEESVETVYDLPATANDTETELTTVTTTTAVDGYGNPTRITVTTDDHANSKRFQQVTANTYGAASDTWSKQFGRLTKTDVTRKRDEAGDGTYETTGSRSSSFSYYTGNDTKKGLLHTEVRDTVMEGAKVKIPAHTTTYAYDTFGNRVQARVQAASGSGANSSTETRCNHNTLAYDSYGRFVVKEKDCLGRVVRRLRRYNAHGLPIRTERVINSSPLRTVSTTYSYTAGGRLYFSHSADGSYTRTAWKDCDANCPTGAAYYVQTEQAGGGESREYRDALGRAVRSAVQGFDGTWIHTDTEYDHLGRVARRSEPYYAGAVKQYWTRYEYDLLGRVTRTTLPDYDAGATNSLITVRYDGLATTTTNGKGQRQVQTRNALGEVIRTADHAGTTVTHTYNAWGQVTGTRTSGTGVDAVTVAMAYDGRGRRTTLTDPDRGTWTYAWNGFDELVTQTDAVGNVQALSYDGLGRVSARLDYRARQTAPVANTQWEYDPANGLGQLGEVREMPFSGHRRTHRYDRLGRPDTTTQRLGRDGTYYSKQTYDGVGRVRQVFDAARAGATWTTTW